MDTTLKDAVRALVHRARHQWRLYVSGCSATSCWLTRSRHNRAHIDYAKKLLTMARNLKEAARHLESTE